MSDKPQPYGLGPNLARCIADFEAIQTPRALLEAIMNWGLFPTEVPAEIQQLEPVMRAAYLRVATVTDKDRR